MLKRVMDAVQGKAPLSSKRSGKWPKVRKEFLEKNPTCAVCGSLEKVEAHHIHSFVEHPEDELHESGNNLIALCESNPVFSCHRIFGHLNNFQQVNPDVVEDAKLWSKKLKDAKEEMLSRKNKKE